MFNIKNKKGLSNLISSVLIIVLSISAIGLISVTVLNFIDNPNLSPETSCLIISSKSLVEIQSACFNNNTNDVEVVVKRNVDESIEINNLNFVVENSENSSSWVCGNSCGDCHIQKIGTTKAYYFSGDNQDNSVSLLVNNCLINKINIATC